MHNMSYDEQDYFINQMSDEELLAYEHAVREAVQEWDAWNSKLEND